MSRPLDVKSNCLQLPAVDLGSFGRTNGFSGGPVVFNSQSYPSRPPSLEGVDVFRDGSSRHPAHHFYMLSVDNFRLLPTIWLKFERTFRPPVWLVRNRWGSEIAPFDSRSISSPLTHMVHLNRLEDSYVAVSK